MFGERRGLYVKSSRQGLRRAVSRNLYYPGGKGRGGMVRECCTCVGGGGCASRCACHHSSMCCWRHRGAGRHTSQQMHQYLFKCASIRVTGGQWEQVPKRVEFKFLVTWVTVLFSGNSPPSFWRILSRASNTEAAAFCSSSFGDTGSHMVKSTS